jgi:transposase InsO family protein
MKKIHEQARGNPGVRRMRAGLAALGHLVSHKRVHRLMLAAGLRGRHPRAWKRTTIGGDRPVPAPDLIGRDFTAARPDAKWCGDVTYIKTWDGWAYLATVLDLSSRKVVGWAAAAHMRTSRAQVPLPGDHEPRPDREGPPTLDQPVEGPPQRLRHHLRRPPQRRPELTTKISYTV